MHVSQWYGVRMGPIELETTEADQKATDDWSVRICIVFGHGSFEESSYD